MVYLLNMAIFNRFFQVLEIPDLVTGITFVALGRAGFLPRESRYGKEGYPAW
jgi:hypothetical protein